MKKIYVKAEMKITYFNGRVDLLSGSNELPLIPVDELFTG